MAKRVVDELDANPSMASLRYSGYQREVGRRRTGGEIVETLLKDAEPAVLAFTTPDKLEVTNNQLRLDRGLLELFAVRGRNMTAYNAAKKKYGL
jgi:hypothetical protein